MIAWRRKLRDILGDNRGTALVEFAFALPVLITLTVGGIDMASYLLLNMKLQNAAFAVADLTARDKTLSEDQLDNIMQAVEHIVKPFEFGTAGITIVSGIVADEDGAVSVGWQREGAGAATANSTIGAVGDEPVLPTDLTLSANETLIAAEVVYNYEPLFGLIQQSTEIRKIAYFRPRLGTLSELE